MGQNDDLSVALADPVFQAFKRVVQAVEPKFAAAGSAASDRLDSVRKFASVGEPSLAFEVLLENLNENDIDVSDAVKVDLRYLATTLGKLDHTANAGKYW